MPKWVNQTQPILREYKRIRLWELWRDVVRNHQNSYNFTIEKVLYFLFFSASPILIHKSLFFYVKTYWLRHLCCENRMFPFVVLFMTSSEKYIACETTMKICWAWTSNNNPNIFQFSFKNLWHLLKKSQSDPNYSMYSNQPNLIFRFGSICNLNYYLNSNYVFKGNNWSF